MGKILNLEEELKLLEEAGEVVGLGSLGVGKIGFHGPILITEDENYYKVKIHYHNKELVKYIEGWQWNATEKKWFFKKNKKTFDELQKFKKYAAEFKITEPNENEYPPSNQFIEEEKIDTTSNQAKMVFILICCVFAGFLVVSLFKIIVKSNVGSNINISKSSDNNNNNDD